MMLRNEGKLQGNETKEVLEEEKGKEGEEEWTKKAMASFGFREQELFWRKA